MIPRVINILISVLAVIIVFVPHEYAHAWVAYKNGDPTAKFCGRMTLNPLKHIDPIGFVMCALVGFGWAKPVPINPFNFRNYKKGLFTTAIAGVTVNYITAFIFYLFYCLILLCEPSTMLGIYAVGYVGYFFYRVFALCLCSVVFNLLPLHPLDGFRVVEAFTREFNPIRRFLREYSKAILIVLIVESFLCGILADSGIAWASNCDILGFVMKFATNIIGWPIKALWSLIF